MSLQVNIQRGSDREFSIIWPGEDERPVDLTGWTVEAFEPHPLLDGNLTVEFGDQSIGEILVGIEWDDNYQTGAKMTFQVRVKNGEIDLTTPIYIANITTSTIPQNTLYSKPYILPISAGGSGGTGPKGDKGDTGDTGPAGPAGPAGADGADGLDGVQSDTVQAGGGSTVTNIVSITRAAYALIGSPDASTLYAFED